MDNYTYMSKQRKINRITNLKYFLLISSILIIWVVFTVLTNQDTSVYTGTSFSMDNLPVFSYEDATKIAESLR